MRRILTLTDREERNGPLAAGTSTEFGFQGSGSPSGLTATGCTVN